MSDKEQVKSCYALKRGHSFIAMSSDRATLEALRHGQDETVVEGFFTTARPGSQQKESLDLEKVLEEFKKTFPAGWRYGEHDESLTRAEIESFIRTHWPKPDPRFVEVGKIEWPKKMDISGFTEGRGRGSDAHMIAVATNSAIVACKAAVLKAGEKG